MILIQDFDGKQPLPEAFIDIARQVYVDDPNWLPEEADGLRKQFSATNPWFDGRRACVAVIEGKGRLAGFLPGQEINGEPVAFFGFWEAVEDVDANRELFAAVEAWARSHGAKRLYGPINFSTFGANRLRLDTFELGCFPGEPYNPAYYPALMEQLGYTRGMRYYSYPVNIEGLLEGSRVEFEKIKPVVDAHFAIEALTPQVWLDNLDQFYELVEQIFGQNFAYTPISREAFGVAMGEAFAAKMCPHASILARTPDGRIAGFFIAVPDYAPLIKQGAAARIDASEFKFDRDFERLPHPRAVLAKSVGIHPDFRRTGLSIYLGLELSRRARELGGYDTVIGALIREDNPSGRFPSRHVFDTRMYGMFEKAL